MNWLNIETSTLDSEEFVGSDPVARATWLCLFRYCAGQENGGTITDCRDWADRKWQQIVRVTRAEVETDSALWSWHGNDLRVWAYPADKEAEVQAKRAGGRNGGKSTSEAKTQAARTNGAKHNPSLTQAATQAPTEAEPKLEPNGMEGKGKEGNRKKKGSEEGSADVAAPSLTDSEWLAQLTESPAYKHVDVAREHAKATEWCRVKRRKVTRKFFLAWLNRIDPPMDPLFDAASDPNAGMPWAGRGIA